MGRLALTPDPSPARRARGERTGRCGLGRPFESLRASGERTGVVAPLGPTRANYRCSFSQRPTTTARFDKLVLGDGSARELVALWTPTSWAQITGPLDSREESAIVSSLKRRE